jgi:hypothetical protein
LDDIFHRDIPVDDPLFSGSSNKSKKKGLPINNEFSRHLHNDRICNWDGDSFDNSTNIQTLYVDNVFTRLHSGDNLDGKKTLDKYLIIGIVAVDANGLQQQL